ncbi:MAG: ABC transporter ATP-binding protein [Desulfococcaceae bacterium]
MTMPVLTLRGLCKDFGAIRATEQVNLDFFSGEIHALIGPNGAGKTTLINQTAGELKPDAGAILFEGRDITSLPVHRRSALGIARTFQATNIFNGFTALDNVALAVQARDGHSFRFWKPARRVEHIRDAALTALGQVGLAHRAGTRAFRLSYGEQRLVGIAMALASGPRALLLDEPMAGMGARASAEMVGLLRRLKDRMSLLLVEHDMDAVFSLADRISVLVYGRIIASGAPEEIRRSPAVREAYLGEEEITLKNTATGLQVETHA